MTVTISPAWCLLAEVLRVLRSEAERLECCVSHEQAKVCRAVLLDLIDRIEQQAGRG